MKFDELVALIQATNEALQKRAVTAVDRSLVMRNWLVGMYIVEFEQQGEDRAKYGQALLSTMAARLSHNKARGFSETNLRLFRQFYRTYTGIRQSLPDEFVQQFSLVLPAASQAVDVQPLEIHQAVTDELGIQLPLSWTHYAFLIQIDNENERRFYEVESAQEHWSTRELKRQFNASLYERLALSRNKAGIRELAAKGQVIQRPADAIKSPCVLEFLNLDEQAGYSESDLEAAIIDRIEHFLMELGKGFLFQSRQYRLTFDEKHFWVDLVFYNRLLRCFVVVDLKIGDITHRDIGQLQMYVNHFDREVKAEDENPSIGILLCKKKNDAVVEMTLPTDNETIFASRYQLYLPSKEELRMQLETAAEDIQD